jgi:GNAT superfamily N-acetyltransferase
MEVFSMYTIKSIPEANCHSILDVQRELAVGQDLLAKRSEVAERGMLISGHDLESLKKYYALKGGILLASANNDVPVGYLLYASGSIFTTKWKNALMEWESEETERRVHPIMEFEKYVYLDQIGVRWAWHRKGVASGLLRAFEESVKGQDVLVLIMTVPLYNAASVSFFLSANYEKVATIHFKHFGIMNACAGILVWKRC